MTELTITIKTEESTYRQKFLLYKTYTMDASDPVIRECIQQAQQALKCEPDMIEDIKVRALLVIK